MIRRHLRLLILIVIELAVILMIAAGSFGAAGEMHFAPEDFADNLKDRDNISVDEGGVHFSYDESVVQYNDEGLIQGDDLLTGKFALGSGAWEISASYEAEADNAYVELYSESWITETVSSKLFLDPGKTHASSKIYIPFGRSMHDIQMNIHYTGPGDLTVYDIQMNEVLSYRWVPVFGYFIFFILLDILLWVIFADSGHSAREYLRDHYEIPLLAVIVFLSSLPAFADFLYVGHDMEFHLARIIAVSHEISYGQFPVRMLTDMLQGYGYPTSTFYCDFFMYPFALLYLMGLPLRMCWQFYVLAANILTSVISYYVFRRISGNRNTGLLIAALYTLSAYRIVDVYLRSAMGEFTAMAFIPLVVLGIWLIYYEEDEKNGWMFLAGGMTAIALCHLLSLEMISLFLIFFCLFEYRKTFTFEVLTAILKAAAVTVLLSAWFIFPMLLSMREISISMYDHQKYLQANAAYPGQVFNLFMRGSGYSTVATPKEMPLSLGGGIIVALALLLYAALKRGFGDRHRQRVAVFLIGLSLAFSMWFFPWDSIASVTDGRLNAISRLARMIQYPWRFLEITTVLLCITAAAIMSHQKERAYNGWAFVLILGTMISLGAFYDPFINEADWTRASDEHYMDKSIGGEEYLPGASGRIMDLPHNVEVTEGGEAEVISYEYSGGERRVAISNGGDATSVLIPVFAYPGYHAEDMDTHNEMGFSAGKNARIALDIPAGYQGTVRVYYREPVLWRVFEIISLLTAICMCVYIFRKRKQELL